MSENSLGKQAAENHRKFMIEQAWQSTAEARAERIKAAVEVTEEERNELPNWTTKDSGERVQFVTGMQRDVTAGKPRFDLIDPLSQAYEETMTYRHAMLMARGAEKYGARNWEKASTPEELERFKESSYRHFMSWYHGLVDEDHAAAVLFNIRGAEMVKGRL